MNQVIAFLIGVTVTLGLMVVATIAAIDSDPAWSLRVD